MRPGLRMRMLSTGGRRESGRDTDGRYEAEDRKYQGNRKRQPNQYTRDEYEPDMRRRRDMRDDRYDSYDRYDREGERYERREDNGEVRYPEYDGRRERERYGRAESRFQPGYPIYPDMRRNGLYDGGNMGFGAIREYRPSSHYERDGQDGRERREEEMIRAGGAFWVDAPKKRKLTKEQAEAWVEGMENADPNHPEGGKWSMAEVKALAQKYGIPLEGQRFIDFYAMINAMYSDYYEVAKKFGVSTPDFYAEMAKAWMDDPDAEKNKTGIYYNCIVHK